MDVLLQLEAAGWTSLCDGTASRFYGSTMTPEAVMVLANGQIMSRDEVVAALEHAPTWASYSIDDPRVLPLGADAAALVYTGMGRRHDGSTFVGPMTSIYVRRDGSWRLALYQQTPKA